MCETFGFWTLYTISHIRISQQPKKIKMAYGSYTYLSGRDRAEVGLGRGRRHDDTMTRRHDDTTTRRHDDTTTRHGSVRSYVEREREWRADREDRGGKNSFIRLIRFIHSSLHFSSSFHQVKKVLVGTITKVYLYRCIPYIIY